MAGGAIVLGKLSFPEHPTNMDESKERASAVGASGVVWTFLSCLSFLSSFSVWETARSGLKYCLKGPLNPVWSLTQLSVVISYRCNQK